MLELDGVRRSFGSVTALHDLAFDVPEGTLCGFLGPNGAGKTTAMRIVMGITRPDAGQVRWRGEPVDLSARLRFGYMPEERGLYPKMPAHEQLTYLGRLHGLDASEAASRAGTWLDRIGLGDRRDDRVEDLSLGNQQRVQLAAALVHDPELLVLDEPFSGLDPIAVDVMSDVLRERAAAGVAVVFSSHQLDLVEDLCSTVAVLAEGRLVLDGDVAALKRSGRTRLRVGLETNDGTWPDRLESVDLLSRDGSEVVLGLRDGTDPVEVLRAAQDAGRVTHFSVEQPRLSELFRDAVARDPNVEVPA